MNENLSRERTGQDTLPGFLLRLFWMLIGNAVLLALLVKIYQGNPGAWFSLYDLLFGVAVIALIVIRYVDIAFFQGGTVDNEPATLSHWRRYAVKLVLICAAAWAALHGAAYFL